ncbi:MAG: cupin domain-containing protein [Opitutaceae bacterium]|nr:cupin domain-containing protein [Opitutaceae bacterium]
MICRHPSQGQKLDVAGLNEITVLIDRSETERTEVAMNSWSPGLDGPPHAHDAKEQNFLVTSGRGEVVIGKERFPAAPGDFFFVPAGVVHQTVNLNPDQRLDYFLFNAFLDGDKEGHASFADHIDKVKATRKEQATQQRADADVALAGRSAPGRRGLRVSLPASFAAGVVMISRDDTERCEAVAWHLAPGKVAKLAPDAAKEQTLFVFSGDGTLEVGGERTAVRPRSTVFVPRNTTAILSAGPTGGLEVVSFGSLVR